ncbi:MAG: hypothetical protein ACTHKY_17045 [Ginsengibacter sp.]
MVFSQEKLKDISKKNMNKKEFKEYWDKWHRQWFENIETNLDKEIYGWKIPEEKKGKKEIPICKYLPEPYWGNINNENLKAVFLNTNPGAENEIQNFSMAGEVKKKYLQDGKSYSCTVAKLCQADEYITTKWMNRYRVKWLQDLLGKKESINIDHALNIDLIPWHSESKVFAGDYIKKNKLEDLVKETVIEPIEEIAKTISGGLKNIVIVRGTVLIDILNNNEKMRSWMEAHSEFVVMDEKENGLLPKMNSLLTVIETKKNTEFLVFSGGSNMSLPNANYMVRPVGTNGEVKSLRDFILSQK